MAENDNDDDEQVVNPLDFRQCYRILLWMVCKATRCAGAKTSVVVYSRWLGSIVCDDVIVIEYSLPASSGFGGGALRT